MGGGVRHVGGSWDGADRLETPSYTLADLQIGYSFRSLSVTLDVDNLSDKIHLSSCLARGDCFYGARRTVYGTVRYNF